MKLWIVFVIIYGIIKGSREPVKKEALKNSAVLPVLFGHTFIGFLMTAPSAKGITDIPPYVFFWVVVKSLSIFVGWIFAFKGIKKIPVSVYGIADMSRVIFSTLLGIVFLHESLTFRGAISLFLVAAGLYFANQKKDIDNGEYQYKYIIYVFLSCFFNAISGTLDKYIMSTGEITSSALQFWFMLLISVFYLSYMLIKKEKLKLKIVFTNPWVYLLSFSLVFGDRLLFIANQDPAAKVTIMTVLKQSSAVVTILLGKLLYKEKNIARKLACALVIICGIALSVIR